MGNKTTNNVKKLESPPMVWMMRSRRATKRRCTCCRKLSNLDGETKDIVEGYVGVNKQIRNVVGKMHNNKTVMSTYGKDYCCYQPLKAWWSGTEKEIMCSSNCWGLDSIVN